MVLNTIFGCALLATVVLPGTVAEMAWQTGGIKERRADLPPFIVIVLDMQSGIAGLPPAQPEIAAGRQELENTFSQFRLFSHA